MATAASVLTETWETLDGTDWLIAPLDGKDMLRVSDVATFDGKGRTLFNAEVCITAITHGLKGWRNFPDKDGNEVLFTSNQDVNIKRIPFDVVRNLAMLILGRSEIGAEDTKN